MAPPPPPKTSRGPAWRARLLLVLVLLVLGSIVARVVLSNREPATPPPQPAGASGLVPGTAPPPEAEPEPAGARAALPYVTECGVAMLLGLGFGIATRMAFRLALLLFVVAFVVVQYLAHTGLVDVDWGGVFAWCGRFILNVSSDRGLGAVVQHKLPTAAALLLGLVLGLRR